MTPKRQAELLKTLRARFETNSGRHEGLDWAAVQARLAAAPDKLSVLEKMESTGGEPDVVAYDATIDKYVFYDCSPESPIGRRSLCYDREALERRKQNKPEGNAIDAASGWGSRSCRKTNIGGCRRWAASIRRRQAGWRRLRRFAHSAARFFVTADTTVSSRITTVRIPTMPPGVSAVR